LLRILCTRCALLYRTRFLVRDDPTNGGQNLLHRRFRSPFRAAHSWNPLPPLPRCTPRSNLGGFLKPSQLNTRLTYKSRLGSGGFMIESLTLRLDHSSGAGGVGGI